MIHARNDYQRIQDLENKIPADEPVFLLRAQDQTAAETVRFWIRQQKKIHILEPAKTEGEKHNRKKMLALATAHAYRMESWEPQKPADMP